jgi:hypothetical protein
MDRLICSPAYNNVHSRAISDHSGPSVGHVLHSHTIDAGQCIMYKLAHAVYLSGLQSETFYHSILFLFYFCYTDCPPLRSTGKVSFCVTRMHPPPPCVETCASPSCEKKKEHLPWPGNLKRKNQIRTILSPLIGPHLKRMFMIGREPLARERVSESVCACLCVCACVHACVRVRACVRACTQACVHVCACDMI